MAIPKNGHLAVFQLHQDRGRWIRRTFTTETAERSFGGTQKKVMAPRLTDCETAAVIAT